MDLKKFRAIAPGIDKEIGEVFLKYGLKVGKRGATINEREGTVNFRLVLVDTNLKDESGNATTPEALRYKQNAGYIGMKPGWLNQPVKRGAGSYSIIGLKDRGSKRILFTVAGKSGTYVTTVEDARGWFGLPRDRTIEELRAAAFAS